VYYRHHRTKDSKGVVVVGYEGYIVVGHFSTAVRILASYSSFLRLRAQSRFISCFSSEKYEKRVLKLFIFDPKIVKQ
jgi:hypothetical protein